MSENYDDYNKAGLPPGTLVHVGKKRTGKAGIDLIRYNENRIEHFDDISMEKCLELCTADTINWINIDGVHNVDLIEKSGSHFGIHPLVQEDVMNTAQRPKLDAYEKYLFITLKMIYIGKEKENVEFEHVSLVLGENYLISFQEVEGDVLDPIRKRLETSRGIIRKMGTDYLAYSILDAIIDNYFVVLEELGDRIEELEDLIINEPSAIEAQKIHKLRKTILQVRRSVWPLRELINSLQRPGVPIVKDTTGIYLRDLYDHTIQVIDAIENYREMLSGILDIYLSSVSNRMNEVMKVLTIIATIFIPLTFIAGIYGMNFKYMPELEWKWAYHATLLIMVVISALMILYFKKKKWI